MSNVTNFRFKTIKKKAQKNIPPNAHCPYCNVIMERENSEHLAYLSLDHINPYSKSKNNAPSNLVASCIRCNQLKSDKSSFTTFKLKEPKYLQENEIYLLSYHSSFAWSLPCLEEIRVLLMNKDWDSIKWYRKYFSKKSKQHGRKKIMDIVCRILFLKTHPQFVKTDNTVKHLLNGTNYTKENIDVFLEMIIDDQINSMSKIINQALPVVSKLDYTLETINIEEIKESLPLVSEYVA